MEKLTCNGENLFGVIDKRPESTFCTLTYSCALDEGSIISINDKCLSLIEHFVFVAYKNGSTMDKDTYLLICKQTFLLKLLQSIM